MASQCLVRSPPGSGPMLTSLILSSTPFIHSTWDTLALLCLRTAFRLLPLLFSLTIVLSLQMSACPPSLLSPGPCSTLSFLARPVLAILSEFSPPSDTTYSLLCFLVETVLSSLTNCMCYSYIIELCVSCIKLSSNWTFVHLRFCSTSNSA